MRIAYTVSTDDCDPRPPTAFDAPLSVAISELAAMGYDGIELQVRDPGTLDMAQLSTLLAELHMGVAALATGPMAGDGHSLVTSDLGVIDAALESLTILAGHARELGAPITLGGMIGGFAAARERPDRLKRLQDSLCELLDRTSTYDVPILIEPQNSYCTDLINSVDDALALTIAIGSSRIGIVVDSFHAHLSHISVEEALTIAAVAHQLNHIQLSDSNRRRPGAGSLPMGSIISVLNAFDFQGWITMEHTQDDGRSTAAQALEAMRLFEMMPVDTHEKAPSVASSVGIGNSSPPDLLNP